MRALREHPTCNSSKTSVNTSFKREIKTTFLTGKAVGFIDDIVMFYL